MPYPINRNVVPTGAEPPKAAPDPHVERLKSMQVWQVAYCRDVCHYLGPRIKGFNVKDGETMVGRAYTVQGPDIYIDAVEGIGPGMVFVHGGCHPSDAVFAPGWTHAYLNVRGAVGVVVDGGVFKSYECGTAKCPIFAAFPSPQPAINRRSAPSVGTPIQINGVTVQAGDIIMGDTDGVCVIPKECEDDLFAGLEGFVEGNGMFGKVAALGLAKGIPMSEQPAIADMFARKFANPECYWRDYEAWWKHWKPHFPGIEATTVASPFYAGKQDTKPKSKL